MTCPRCQYDNRPGAKFCEQCARAVTMYRKMDMRFWVEQAEAELAPLR